MICILHILRPILAGVSASVLWIACAFVAPYVAPAAAATIDSSSIEFGIAFTPSGAFHFGNLHSINHWREKWASKGAARDWQLYTVANWLDRRSPAPAGAAQQPLLMSIGDITRPPIGWVEFCTEQPQECAGASTTLRDVVLTPQTWNDLRQLNRWVNDLIKPITDLDHWGVEERWSYPEDGYGDCEDYVLLKRRILIQSGWPREALLITVVRDKEGEGHAVLTVKTDRGEFILDNQKHDILSWLDTGYRFIKRQSQSDPNIWVSLGASRPALSTAASR